MEACSRRCVPSSQLFTSFTICCMWNWSAASLNDLSYNHLFGNGISQSCQSWCTYNGPTVSLHPDGSGIWICYSTFVQDFQGKKLAEGNDIHSFVFPWSMFLSFLLIRSDGMV